MAVAELINILRNMPQDARVVVIDEDYHEYGYRGVTIDLEFNHVELYCTDGDSLYKGAKDHLNGS